MSLELFEKHPDMDAYRVGGAYQPYAIIAVDKRFTDSELAAEYWAEEKGLGDLRGIAEKQPGYLVIEPILLGRVLALHRFATQPSYDE